MQSHQVKKKNPTTFHQFHKKCAKNNEHYESKNNKQYFMKTAREVPERPREDPRAMVLCSGEKYFSYRFHHFRAKYFSSSRNFPPLVLDTVMSPRAHTTRNPINIYKEPTKNSYGQNKLAIP